MCGREELDDEAEGADDEEEGSAQEGAGTTSGPATPKSGDDPQRGHRRHRSQPAVIAGPHNEDEAAGGACLVPCVFNAVLLTLWFSFNRNC